MVALSPRFTFLATICVLAALSSAPVSDAAVLRLRASDPALANMAPGHWFRSHSSRVADFPPVLPLPKSPVESHKKSADSSDSPSSLGNKNDQKIPSDGGSQGGKDVPSDADNGNTHEEGGKIRVRISDLIVHHVQLSSLVRIGSSLEPVPIDNATESTVVWW
jgi:hypothetical protein